MRYESVQDCIGAKPLATSTMCNPEVKKWLDETFTTMDAPSADVT